MSTEIQNVVRDNRWSNDPIQLVQFCGPVRGEGQDRRMVQVTMRNNDEQIGFIQLTRGEAARLANRLNEWAAGNAIIGDGCND